MAGGPWPLKNLNMRLNRRRATRASRPIRLACLTALSILTTQCFLLPHAVEAAQIEEVEGLRVVRLSGSPYELGRQHGELLREEVRGAVAQVLGYFRRYLKIPWVGTWAAN